MGAAAAIAGLELGDFLSTLSRYEQDVFVVDFDDLDQEPAFLAKGSDQAGAGA